jgi:hypothetical protein
MIFVVCCVLLCVQDVVGSWVSAVGSYSKYDISYYGIVLGVGISIVVLDTYAILVEYLAWENGGREKNDKSVVCVVCCKKLLSTNHDFPNGKYETCICRNRYMCGQLVFRNIWHGKTVGEKNLKKRL